MTPLPYFHLEDTTIFVTGKMHGAMYDLAQGDVYGLDRPGRLIAELLEQGNSVKEVVAQLNHVEKEEEILAFLNELETLQLGRFTPIPLTRTKLSIPAKSNTLERIWLEVAPQCNLRCLHCYADDLQARIGLRPMGLNQWLRIIEEAANLGVRWLQFIGGEPLTVGKETLSALMHHARESHIEFIEIFTNGTLIDDDWIECFKAYQVNVALSIYSCHPEIHDAVTRRPGSFDRLTITAGKLLDHGVPFRFGLVVMDLNESSEEETLIWLKEVFGDVHVTIDVIRGAPAFKARESLLIMPDLWRRRLRTAPRFPKVTPQIFSRNQSGHPCLNGVLCVHADGAVYPCIMERSRPVGNVRSSTLESIVSKRGVQEIWRFSKDHIDDCRDCEFRYVCFDCRPLALSVAAYLEGREVHLSTRDPCCLYDPARGTWGKAEDFLGLMARRMAINEPPIKKENYNG